MKQCTYNILALLVFALSFSYVPTAAYEYHCVYDGVTTFNVPIFIFQQVFLASNSYSSLAVMVLEMAKWSAGHVMWPTKKNKKKK